MAVCMGGPDRERKTRQERRIKMDDSTKDSPLASEVIAQARMETIKWMIAWTITAAFAMGSNLAWIIAACVNR